MMGRPKTTGRYDTREELEETVWFLWKETACNVRDISRQTRISDGTVNLILGENKSMFIIKA
jgi:hypothetical protein